METTLEPGKFYTNDMGKKYRCVKVHGDKATLVVFGNFLGKTLEVEYVQDKNYWGQYVPFTDSAEIERLEKRYQDLLAAKQPAPNTERSKANSKIGRNERCLCGSGKKYKKCCGSTLTIQELAQLKPKWRFDDEQKVWRKQYHSRRYLEFMSEDELVRRAEDLIRNNLTLNEQLKIGLHPTNEEAGYWAEMFTHVLEECVLRNQHYSKILRKIDRTIIPKFRWPGLRDAVKKVEPGSLESGNHLIKYGLSRWLSQTLEKGVIRIAPASQYNDPSLNSAIRDSELELSMFSLPSEVKVQKLDGITGEVKGDVEVIGNVERTVRSPTNYYVYCLARTFAPRLFGDFEADSCLIIKRPRELIQLLERGFAKQLSGWKCMAKPVAYVDPINSAEFEPEVYLSKHFRYAYQKEYRVVWLPPKVEMALDPLFLELGNLEEYCELINLPSEKAA